MSAKILAFPNNPSAALALRAIDALARLDGQSAPMGHIAAEILHQDAEGLLDETDRELARAATDLAVLIGTVTLAQQKLRVARWIMAPEPPAA